MAANITYQELSERVETAWSDDFPVILFPVKVQVRFMTCLHIAPVSQMGLIANANRVRPQLPDAIKLQLADLTTRLNEGAVQPAAILLPAQQVPRNSSNLFPPNGFAPKEDQKELWVRIYPDDVHLATHETALAADEFESGKSFWKEMNKASAVVDLSDKRTLQVAAWRVLASGYGNARAAWIAKNTRPANFNENATVKEDNLSFPNPPDAGTGAWNIAPQTKSLPEYFAVKTYREIKTEINGQLQKVLQVKEHTGRLIPDTLQLSIDPNESEDGAFQETNKGISMNEGMKWLVDFEEAEKVGMAVRIVLTNEEATTGFDKVIVIGVRPSLDADDTENLITNLFVNHHYKPGGMSIIPQGTPTNNTEENNSGRGLEDLSPQESFELEFNLDAFTPTSDHVEKSDGQRLAEAFGVENSVFQSIYYNTGKDVSDGIKINQALWHATLGYSLPQFLYPIIRGSEVDQTCRFMVNYALSRGFIPAIRIDDQPYGVLPTMDFAHFHVDEDEEFARFVGQLNEGALKKLDMIWNELVEQVFHLGKDTSSDQFASAFYKVLELHAGSITYDQQLILGKSLLAGVQDPGAPTEIIVDPGKEGTLKQLVQERLAVDLNQSPIALNYTQANIIAPLTGANIVDHMPPSDTLTIEALEGSEKNYIEWLGDFTTTYDRLKNEDFTNFTGSQLSNPPQSLLYNLMRFALLRHYLSTAMRIKYKDNPVLGEAFSVDFEESLLVIHHDPANPNVITSISLNTQFRDILLNMTKKDKVADVKREAFELFPDPSQADNRAAYIAEHTEPTVLETFSNQYMNSIINVPSNANDLYANDKLKVLDFQITVGGQTKSIKSYIDENIQNFSNQDVAGLIAHKRSLQGLATLSNTALERLLSEHLDACHYRLDAWMTGLANFRLEELRQKNRKGAYLGAYGYLENVRPRISSPGICIKLVENPVTLATAEGAMISPIFPFESVTNPKFSQKDLLKKSFVYLGSGGAFGRIAYDEALGEIMPLPQTDPKNQGFIPAPSLVHAVTAAVLRNAYVSHKNTGAADETFAINLSSARVREAMYFLEGLENGQEISGLLGYKFERSLRESSLLLTQYIYEFREKYPFRVQDIDKPTGSIGSDTLDSRIVVDGKRMLQDQRSGQLDLFLNTLLPALNNAQKNYIKDAVAKLETILDSINDLLMAESFYQIAAGNADRSRAALKMLNDAGNIQLPDIVKIPRSGYSLTHRVGIMLPAAGTSVEWGGAPTARAVMEPRLNRYLKSKLPIPEKILIRVRWKTGESATGVPEYEYDNVQLSKLLIQPIDFVYMYYHQRNSDNRSELQYRINEVVRAQHQLPDHQFVEILEKDRTDFKEDQVHLFALDPLLMSLAEMALGARYLKPQDLILPTDSTIKRPNDSLDWKELNSRLNTLYNSFSNEYDDLIKRQDKIKTYTTLTEEAIAADLANIRTATILLRKSLLFFAGLGIGNALPSLDQVVDKLSIEALYFQAKATSREIIERLNVLLELGIMKKSDLVIDNAGSTRDLMLSDVRDRVVNPLKSADIGAHFNGLSANEIVDELIKVIQSLMGRSFKPFPVFRIQNQTEVDNAFKHNALMDFCGDLAVEEWIQSLAPVRPKMHLYLKLNMLTDIFHTSGAGKQLKPIQMPFHPEGYDRWLGMEYPEDYETIDPVSNTRKISEDTLSLVFEYSDNFQPSVKYSGMVFDEWNELIPEKSVNTGVAMHYDQPNSEAPNTILLALPAAKTGKWQIDSLFNTIDSTVQMAKKRAVDPDILKTSFLNQFLPAVMAAINIKSTTPSLDLGRAVAATVPGTDGMVMNKFESPIDKAITSVDVGELGITNVFHEDDL